MISMIRFGVIGAGNIAKTFSMAVKKTEGILYAISSRDLLKAQSYQETFGYEVAYGSYEEMVLDPKVDCVYVATPHGLHAEHMKLAIEHKKHVLCEKSFTLNEAQAKEIIDLARQHQVFLMEAMWTRFLPTIQKTKDKIDAGLIGDIEKINVSFGFNAIDRRKNRLFDPYMGGGALLDIGVYTITFANIFLGEPQFVTSDAMMDNYQYDVSHQINYTYPKAKAILISSLNEDLSNDAYIHGTKGYVVIENFWRADHAKFYDNYHRLIDEVSIPHEENGFEYQIREVISCIKNHQLESSIMTHEITLTIMKQMDFLRKSWDFYFPQEIEQ